MAGGKVNIPEGLGQEGVEFFEDEAALQTQVLGPGGAGGGHIEGGIVGAEGLGVLADLGSHNSCP